MLSKPRGSSLRPKIAQPFTSTRVQNGNDEILCGPVDVFGNFYHHGDKGHIVLTSETLLKSKVRILHVVFKNQGKSLVKGDESSNGRNGFSDLEEISVTVRSMNSKFNVETYTTLFKNPGFSNRLIDIVCNDTNSELSDKDNYNCQWFALELLCWIAGVSIHQDVRFVLSICKTA